jgi:4-amino-4-deoxy-L-arabinose transferase-like glycosyltransferase
VRADVAIVAGFTALAALLRFATLDVQSFGHDESVTAGHVLDPNFIQMLKEVPGRESTPPLYYVTAWFWSKLFGTGEVGLRALSAVFGTALVPVAYALAAKLASRRVGAVLCALVAVNPMLVWFSQEARAYSLLVLTSAVSVLVFVYALESPTRRRLALWAAASALALATHYFALFLLAAEAIWLLARWRRQRDVRLAIAAVTFAGLVLAPVAIYQAAADRTGWIARIPLGERLTEAADRFLVGPNGAELAYVVPVAATLVGVGLVLLAWRAEGRERSGARVAAVLGLAVVLVPLGLALAGAGADRVIAKNLLPALVPLMLVVAAGLGARRSGLLGTAATVGLCVVSVLVVVRVAASSDLQRPDWRGAAELIRAGGSAAVVTGVNGDDPLRLYLDLDDYWEGLDPPVDEVVVVGRDRTDPSPGLAGFEATERRELGWLSVTRLRSNRPRRLAPSALVRLLPDEDMDEDKLLLYEPEGSQ